MRRQIFLLIAVLTVSCSTPQLSNKDVSSDFTADNLLSKSLFITPVINLTIEKDLNTVDVLSEKILRSERKYYHWIGVKKTREAIAGAALSKELDECLKQHSEGKTIDRRLVQKLSPVLKDNYIVFTALKGYNETEDMTSSGNNSVNSFKSYLEGVFTVYDLKTGLPVFNTAHSVNYNKEITGESEPISMNSPKDAAGDCIGSCISEWIGGCVTGIIFLVIAPSPEEMAGKFFEEIGDNFPEKR